MARSTALQPVEVQVEPVIGIQTERTCRMDPGAISAEMGSALSEVNAFAVTHQLTVTGPPRAIYHEYDPNQVRFTAALPIAAPPEQITRDYPSQLAMLPGGKTWRFTHTGPYSELAKTYGAVTEWMKDEGLIETEADWVRFTPMWEEYMNDPRTTPESDLVTYIYVPAEKNGG